MGHWRKVKHHFTNYERAKNRYHAQYRRRFEKESHNGINLFHSTEENQAEPSWFGKLLFGDAGDEDVSEYDEEFDFTGWVDEMIDNLIWGGQEDDNEV